MTFKCSMPTCLVETFVGFTCACTCFPFFWSLKGTHCVFGRQKTKIYFTFLKKIDFGILKNQLLLTSYN